MGTSQRPAHRLALRLLDYCRRWRFVRGMMKTFVERVMGLLFGALLPLVVTLAYVLLGPALRALPLDRAKAALALEGVAAELAGTPWQPVELEPYTAVEVRAIGEALAQLVSGVADGLGVGGWLTDGRLALLLGGIAGKLRA